ncbi:MAG TPA: GNAT family N-acetyltransferase [Bryobacteraceae bacterium]|nr:GNAT family N-acetyltransferase [Bryobacteraceae bacterium]
MNRISSVSETQDLARAVQAQQQVCRYDCMRLELYREREQIADRIAVARFGSALALRFEDVGYFNRVYSPDEAIYDRLSELEEFWGGSPFGCELVGPPGEDGQAGGRPIRRAGWQPATRFAWMHGDPEWLAPVPAGTFDIRAPEPWQREQFLLAYLQAFEAAQHRIPAALRNMRHLFDRPELDFLLAWIGGRPAGVGITMYAGRAALLCAGAARPEFRGRGCHTALLRARILLARKRRCEEIYSWAVLGGRSHSNLEKAGLKTVGTTTCWRFVPESRR